MKNLTKGFTLIELLVVVAIIALLSAIIIGSLSGARQKAKDSKIMSQLSSLRSQMEIYYNSNGSYGSTGNASSCGGSGPFATGSDNASKLIQGIAQDINGSPTNFGYMACWSNAESWAVQAWLPGAKRFWCVDSGGASVDINQGLIWGNNNTFTCLP